MLHKIINKMKERKAKKGNYEHFTITINGVIVTDYYYKMNY